MENPPDGRIELDVSPPREARTPRRPWKKRIGWTTVGLLVPIVVLVGLEIALRAAGFIYYYEKHDPPRRPDDSFVILCIGDSSTQGGGADPETESYPAQLENILNARRPEMRWRLVNLGRPGMNSSQLARRFEGYVRLYRPSMAMILIGNNDVWNLNESYIHAVGKGESASVRRRIAAVARLWADSLRVVGLARRARLVFGDHRTHFWNPMEHTNPSYGHFREGLHILGKVEQVAELYRLNFTHIARIAEHRGVELLWLDYHVGAKFGETQYVGPVLKEMGQRRVDLFPLFHNGRQPKGMLKYERATAKRELLNPDLWHPNALGYAVFARAVYNQLVEMGKAPGPKFEIFKDLRVHK